MVGTERARYHLEKMTLKHDLILHGLFELEAVSKFDILSEH